MTYRPNNTSEAILLLVHGYLTKKKKNWSLISQSWLLEKLKEWYGVDIARSTLNYNLALLREAGLISTVKRHKRDISGALVCQVTLYKLTKTMRRYMRRLAMYFKNIGWKNLKRRHAAAPIIIQEPDTTPESQEPVEPWEIRSFIESLTDNDLPPDAFAV